MTGLPVLIRCGRVEREGHLVIGNNRSIHVRTVPKQIFEVVASDEREVAFQREYGRMPKSATVSLKALYSLLQAIQTRDPGNLGHLERYSHLKAALEVRRDELEWARTLGKSPTGLRREAEDFHQRTGFWPLLTVPGSGYLKRRSQHILERIRYPLGELCKELNRQLRSARLVLWWVNQEQRLAAGLYCPNAQTALFAVSFSQVAEPEGLAICMRCGKPFERCRTAQKYCSLRCANAGRKARERERRKEDRQ